MSVSSLCTYLNTLISVSLSLNSAISAAWALWRARRSGRPPTGPGMIFTPGVQADRARDETFIVDWALWRGPAFRPIGPGMRRSSPTGLCDGARRSGRSGPGWDVHRRLGSVTRLDVQADRAQDKLGWPPREEMTIEVSNITNAIEAYRGPEMKSIGAHLSVRAVINEG
jgi:hypothetical protein